MYSTDWPYSLRCAAALVAWAGLSPWAGIGSNTDPSPTLSHGTSWGSGVHGVWLDTRSISAITGPRWAGASSRRRNSSSTYWSGMVA